MKYALKRFTVKKFISGAALALAFVLCAASSVPADVPFQGYTYNYWGYMTPAPAAYAPAFVLRGEDAGGFAAPADMCVDKNGNLYIMDTGNNRIVVYGPDLKLSYTVDSFDVNGVKETFNNPNGIFVAQDLNVYVADTDNRRVLAFDSDYNLLKIIENPKYETLADNFIFSPLKVCVDKAGRVYAIVKNVYEGIMSFDNSGDFFGYFGTVKVILDPVRLFWRQFSTEAQKAKQRLFIPTEFLSMDVDADGFLYTTNTDIVGGNLVKRLNPKGEDVLINFTKQKISGDQAFFIGGSHLTGPSIFTDVKVRGSGCYTALDSTRGRLYTYDSEGHMLYTTGGIGSIEGMGKKPVVVDELGEYLLVLDQDMGQVVFLKPTEYGRLINKAVALRYDGDEASAVEEWKKVLVLNENYALAYAGIGKALLVSGENREAMRYLKKGMNVEYYSVAFKRYRNDMLKANLGAVMTGALLIGLAAAGARTYVKRKSKGGD